jgi:hypothetical protein
MYHQHTFSSLECRNVVDISAFAFGLPATPFFYIAVDNRPVLHDPRPKAGACSQESSHRGTHRERERELTFSLPRPPTSMSVATAGVAPLPKVRDRLAEVRSRLGNRVRSNGLGAPLSLGRFRHYIPRQRSSQ